MIKILSQNRNTQDYIISITKIIGGIIMEKDNLKIYYKCCNGSFNIHKKSTSVNNDEIKLFSFP